MIPRRFDQISFSDIQALLENSVPEGRTIEYKRDLPDDGDKRKIQFLAGVSALANSGGGDIVFGIDEKHGIPANVPGLTTQDVDSEILRLDSLVRSGIEPRIPDLKTRAVVYPDGRKVLVLRVGHSWAAPHRVSYKDHSKFYGRNSAGKYTLDVSELRAAFTLSELLVERIRRFREARATALLTRDDLPVVLAEGGIIALHVVPVSAFAGPSRIRVTPTSEHAAHLPPIDSLGQTHRFNLDGLVTHENANPLPMAYAQLFRSGAIEAVSVHEPTDRMLLLHPKWFENNMIKSTRQYLSAQRTFGIDGPAYVFITFVAMKGFRLGIGPEHIRRGQALDRDLVLIPEVFVEGPSEDIPEALHPAFDMVWNAFGYDRSPNYDQNGLWRG